MAYSDKFIDELINNMPSCITSFFEKNQEVLELTDYTFHEFVAETLELKYKNFNRRELLSPVAVKVMRARTDKANTLLENYYKLLELKVTNPKSPLHYISLLPDSERKKLYDDISYEDIAEQKRAEAATWKENTSSYLTEFVGISSMSKTLKSNSLRIDIAVFFWRYIDEMYGGNLSAGFVKRILADYPIISGTAFKEILEKDPDEPDTFSLVSFQQKDVSLKLKASGLIIDDLRSLDPMAITILSVIIDSITNMEEFAKTRTVKLPMSKIMNEAFDYSPSVTKYEKVENMIIYMKMVVFSYYNKQTMSEPTNISILDSYSFPMVGKFKWVEVRFSEQIANDIVGDNILSISKAQYKKLVDPNAKVICHIMKKEQIAANQDYVERTVIYDYSFFIGKIRFPSGNIKNILSLLKAALNDFVEQNVIIESYRVEGTQFHITYLPYDEEDDF